MHQFGQICAVVFMILTMNSGLILFKNSASRLLVWEKQTTIHHPALDDDLIQSVHGEEGLFTDCLFSNYSIKSIIVKLGKQADALNHTSRYKITSTVIL